MISGLCFDSTKSDITEYNSYLNIFTYDPTQTLENPQGKLVANDPITSTSLDVENLIIADYTVLGNKIFILDHF